ncbi:MAG: alpha/beta fold hydrolase [Nitriliruptoraceae bacterium]
MSTDPQSPSAADYLEQFSYQVAATRRFTLGVPRALAFSREQRVRFIRSSGPTDPINRLWEVELPDDTAPEATRKRRAGSAERILVDPLVINADSADVNGDDGAEEQARRQRARELAGGITAWSQDESGNLVAFVMAGRLYTHHVPSGATVAHPTSGPAFDPRPSPCGRHIAVVVAGTLCIVDLRDRPDRPGVTRTLCAEDDVRWGIAEFAAAEEMGRQRGYWWAPDGSRLAVCRVDERPVTRWHIADPAQPSRPAVAHHYPAAGTSNADVRLAVVNTDGTRRVDVSWDRIRMPYLTRVNWRRMSDGGERLTLQVQSRDQKTIQILVADPDDGSARVQRTIEDGGALELVAGSPAWLGDQLVTVEDDIGAGEGGTRRLFVDGTPATTPGLQVRSIAGATADRVVFIASEDPTSVDVWTWSHEEGSIRLTDADGVYGAVVGDGHVAIVGSNEARDRPQVHVALLDRSVGDRRGASTPGERADTDRADALKAGSVTSLQLTTAIRVTSAVPSVTPFPRMLTLGDRKLKAALFLPGEASPHHSDERLPVVLDPYGGPHAQRALVAGTGRASSQWLADHGFAVLVIDGRGTPGRGPQWERAVHGDLATPVLADQLDGLDAAARVEPRLNLDRVGIRGWSFGGYLAALAALRAPDRIRAAIAGAPVTDWRLYDTHYTERYLGHPDTDPDAYRVSSLIDAQGALCCEVPPADQRPEILILHGMADDNVVVAHSLRLAHALFVAGWPHRFVPLGSVTHFSTDADMTRRMLHEEVNFLRAALGVNCP